MAVNVLVHAHSSILTLLFIRLMKLHHPVWLVLILADLVLKGNALNAWMIII